MKTLRFLFFFLLAAPTLRAQRVERFEFNLYTDSLKKGFYNYINIDGQLSDGTWRPLDSAHVALSANTGFFKGNDLFIDSSYRGDSVLVTAVLRANPAQQRRIVIHIRRRDFDALPSEQEVLQGPATGQREKKRGGLR
ncbi:MAG: hypothetical protein EOO16_03785 [Chitinophagaceae bacterium]|nr:MAG: hypothetical protein EOO16_03785 [Chitinophagaceae bacterium]